MNHQFRNLIVLMLFGLFAFWGCAEYAPEEPPPATGTVFHHPQETIIEASRNALTDLNFAITKESGEYIEAVHLKPGETVEDNDSELVGIWVKPREDQSVLLLIDTKKRASGIAKQRDWEQDILRKVMQQLP